MKRILTSSLLMIFLVGAVATEAFADAWLHVSNRWNHGLKISARRIHSNGSRGEWHSLGWVTGNSSQTFRLGRGGSWNVRAEDRNGNRRASRNINVSEGETLRWRLSQ